MKNRQAIAIDGKELTLSNLDKVLWPAERFTKGDLVAYYVKVAPYILPHLKDRPLVFTRYPDGVDGKSFYQKNCPPHTPSWVPTFPYVSKESGRTIRFCLCRDVPTLVWLANQACLEIHPWLSRVSTLDYPDFLVLDLDPAPPAGFEQARTLAFLLKGVLDRLRLRSYVKTSGATGLHVYVPTRPRYTYRQVRALAEGICSLLVEMEPHLATGERTVARRTGRVYIDYLQVVKGKTITAPYGVRPLPGAPVSTPLTWPELETARPEDFTILNMGNRLREVGDPFAPVLADVQDLGEALPMMPAVP